MCKVFPYNDMLKDGPTCLTRHLVSQLESKKTQAREHELASFSLWVKYPRFLLSIYFISYLLRFHDKADELFFFLPPSLILPFRLGLGLDLLKFVYFRGFPGDTVVKNLPAKAGHTGSSPGPGRSHMPRSN